MINWEKPNKYWMGSDEGYVVSKQLYKTKATYTAWTSLNPTREIIKGNCKTLDEAKAECELYDMRNQK